ncbi:hypothetical protein [Weizmannia phage Youna2]
MLNERQLSTLQYVIEAALQEPGADTEHFQLLAQVLYKMNQRLHFSTREKQWLIQYTKFLLQQSVDIIRTEFKHYDQDSCLDTTEELEVTAQIMVDLAKLIKALSE